MNHQERERRVEIWTAFLETVRERGFRPWVKAFDDGQYILHVVTNHGRSSESLDEDRIIFSHDFALALWGTGWVCSECLAPGIIEASVCGSCGTDVPNFQLAYTERLKQLAVSEKDRLDILALALDPSYVYRRGP